MMPAAKHGDPQIGVDIHLCVVPPSPSPVPLPTPHTSIVFDPMDYIPFIGATVTVCGMKRAVAGTNAKAIHIPPGFPFAPKIPDTSDEIFMGSATVVADGDPFSFLSVPVLSCQVAGMLSPPRLKKKEKKLMLLPTVTNLAIPTNVFIGGPPTISLMGMAFKFGFAALGRFAKSGAFKWVRKKLFGWMKSGFLKCVILRAEPVDIVTGEVSVEQQDFTLPGRIPIDWVRTYTSNNTRKGACGYGWESPADIRLEVYPGDNSAVFLRPAAAPAPFPELPAAGGNDEAVLELWDGALLSDHGREFRVRTKEDRIYHFDKALAFTNEDGVQEYPINRISDLCGNWLEFERLGRHLMAINESAGRRIEIEIEDGLIRQLGLFVPTAEYRHFFVQYQYDEAANLAAVVDALGNPYTFGYDSHHLTRHTDRNGLSFYYEFDKSGDTWRVVHSWGDGGLYNYCFEYLDELNERRITDSLGNVSLVKLNKNNLPINEIDPLGGVTIFEYDEVGRTTAIVDPDGQRTGYEYDVRGNLIRLSRPDGTAIATEFDPNNRALVITDANGAQWIQHWDERGHLLEKSSPLGSVSRYEYDAKGQLISFLNPRGARAEFFFDVAGNLAGIKDTLGRSTLFAYDLRGNVITKSDPLTRNAIYRFDEKSRLTEACLPSGASISCIYDAEDNLTSYRDGNGAVTQLDYSGQGEVVRWVQADGCSVQYHYDTEERLIGVTNQSDETYRLKRDALGRIIEEIDYWGQPTAYRYTAGGRIIESIDPLQRRVAYETDPLGRILRKTLFEPDAAEEPWEETFDYDANGNLTACANSHIRIERHFDSEGRMLQEKQGENFSIRNEYDEVGNRTSRETQLVHREECIQHRIKYIYDLLDEVVEIKIDNHPPFVMLRDALGQIIAEQLAPTLRRETQYSASGEITGHRLMNEAEALIDIAYSYDAVGNLTERRDAEFGIDQFILDPMGRITQHINPLGRVDFHSPYPKLDRLSTQVVKREVSETVERTRGDWSREGVCAGRIYRFDRAGNLIERQDQSGILLLSWDADQRLAKSTINGTSTVYYYDPLGRRIEKRKHEERTTAFVWDGNALVGDVSSGIGQPLTCAREWVYYPRSFQPIAMLRGATADEDSILYYHNNPNGCPSSLTDGEGKLKWAASYSAFGKTADISVEAVDSPIRLQGQYADLETGLYYNRYRYFEPSIGQFVSQDPLGLNAGPDLYLFGPNINDWIDPLGLTCVYRFHTLSNLSTLLPNITHASWLRQKWVGFMMKFKLYREWRANLHMRGDTRFSPFVSVVTDPNALAHSTDPWAKTITTGLPGMSGVHRAPDLSSFEVAPNRLIGPPANNALSRAETELVTWGNDLGSHMTGTKPNPY